jgi:hypothetical protein
MNQSQRVAQYISDNENDDDMEMGSFNNSGIVKQKIKQNRWKWIPMCTYYNKDSAIDKIKTDGIWSQTHTNITSDGKRVYYRCNQVKRRGKQCPAGVHLLYHSENEKCGSRHKKEKRQTIESKKSFIATIVH